MIDIKNIKLSRRVSKTDTLTYCRVPARWGLQQTTLAPGSDETQARDPKIDKYGPTIGPVLLRQGEPGMSQYIYFEFNK